MNALYETDYFYKNGKLNKKFAPRKFEVKYSYTFANTTQSEIVDVNEGTVTEPAPTSEKAENVVTDNTPEFTEIIFEEKVVAEKADSKEEMTSRKPVTEKILTENLVARKVVIDDLGTDNVDTNKVTTTENAPVTTEILTEPPVPVATTAELITEPTITDSVLTKFKYVIDTIASKFEASVEP